MANQKILDQKQSVINEITDKVKNSTTFVVFNNNGLNVAELTELRRKLRELQLYSKRNIEETAKIEANG